MRSAFRWLADVWHAVVDDEAKVVFWISASIGLVSLGAGSSRAPVLTVSLAFTVLFALRALKRYLFSDIDGCVVVRCCCGGTGGGGKKKVAETAAPIVEPVADEVRCN